jgi:SulP family sulfate permease
VVVLRLKRVRNPDAVCMTLIEAFVNRCRARDVRVLLCGVRDDLERALDRTGLARVLGPDSIFHEHPVRNTSTQAAVRAAYAILGQDRSEEKLPFAI